MATKRLPMRKIRGALRLEASGLSRRQIAASLNIGRTAARSYMDRAHDAGLSWPLPADLSDETLERLLFPPSVKLPKGQRAEPDWALLHLELRKPNVTLSLLWEEYRAAHPNGYGYSRFCDLYRSWKGRNTCRARIAVTPPGRRSVSAARPPASAPTRKP